MVINGYPLWQVLYFGSFSVAATVFFVLTAWTWFKSRSSTTGSLRSGVAWSVLGYLFLFVAAYAACGIVTPPGGSLLSTNVAARNFEWATAAAVLSMFFSLPGWAFVYVGMRKLLKHPSD